MNTEIYAKQLKMIAALAAIACLIWLYWTFGRMFVIFSNPPAAIAQQGHALEANLIAFGNAFFSLALVIILGLFLHQQIKALKNGSIFSRRCERLILLWATVWLFYDCCASNMANIVQGNFDCIVIDGSTIGVTAMVATFSILYKIARQVAEDNQLTI